MTILRIGRIFHDRGDIFQDQDRWWFFDDQEKSLDNHSKIKTKSSISKIGRILFDLGDLSNQGNFLKDQDHTFHFSTPLQKSRKIKLTPPPLHSITLYKI